MLKHFENLWEESENFHKENSIHNNINDNISDSLNEITLKIALLKALEENKLLDKENLEKSREKLIGEILFSMTNLSYIFNVDVFSALKLSLLNRTINFYDKKHVS